MANSDWRQVLKDASTQALQQTGRGLLLSQVPTVLKQAGLDLVQILARRKLLEFLRQENDGQFQLVQNELNGSMWAILPPDVQVTTPFSKYFPAAHEGRPNEEIPRFMPLFWQGFQRSLPPGYRRWLFRHEPIHYQDRPDADDVEGAIEIERQFIRDEAAFFSTNELIYTKIQEWAAKHELDLREFITKSVTQAPGEQVASGKPLEVFLRALRSDERARINLPADVIARLMGI